MSNKNKSQAQVKQSPEKYIKTQARSLPIHECLINSGWKDSMMANVLVTRKHNNGHFTFALYVVDLYCLGIKTSEFFFNHTPEQYNDFKKEYFPEEHFECVNYALVHNVIFAGLEFANDYDFKPCKAFTQYTQFVLEEDSDDIEIIEIECGSDDMPVVIAGKDNREEAEKAYTHLLNTVGPGKFIYTDYEDLTNEAIEQMSTDDDDIEYEDDLEIDEYIYEQALTERLEDIERFKHLEKSKETNSQDESVELLFISKRLFYNYYGLSKIEEARERFMNFLDVNINDDVIPFEFSGSKSGEHDENIEEIINDLSFGDDLKKYNFKKLANKHPEVPFYSFMHMISMNLNKLDEKKIKKQLNEYLSIYPNNLILKLENDQALSIEDKESHIINEKLINESTVSELFNKRQEIHSLEFLTFHSALFAYLAFKQDVLGMDAFIYCTNFLFPEFEESSVEKQIYSEMSKVFFCHKTYIE